MTHTSIHHDARQRWMNRIAAAMTAAAVLATTAGCSTPTSAENKQAAHDRWSLARAGVMYSMAKQQFEVGDLDKAEGTIRNALSTKPDEPKFHELCARISIERGELEKAYYQLETALSFNDKRPETHYLMGIVFQRWQRYEAAMASYDKAFELKPDEVSPLLASSEMLVKLDRPDEAIAKLSEKLVYFEHNAAIRVSLGTIHMLGRRYDAAAKCFREAHLLSPDDPAIVERLAMAMVADGQYAEAIYYLVQLGETPKYADRSDIKVALGDCYMATGKPLDARKVFIELTKTDENNVTGWIKLGQAAWTVGDRNRATEAATRAMRLAPQRHEGYLLAGMIAMKGGKDIDAIKLFSQASSLAPESTAPLILMGMTLEKMGDAPGAVKAYQAALRVDPGDDRARRLLAAVEQ